MSGLELTKDNHFKYGFNSNGEWECSYGAISREVLPWDQECFKLADELSQEYKCALLFSGGADSEVMVRSFAQSRNKFDVYIIRFKDDWNIHDISNAVAYCDKAGIDYTFIDLDVIHFMENEAESYAERMECPSLELLSTMWAMEQIDDTIIIGSGDPLFVKEERDSWSSRWHLQENQRTTRWYEFMHRQGRFGVPGFFQYSPEILLSQCQAPLYQALCGNKLHHIWSSRSYKYFVYQSYFPDLAFRQDYSGYELLDQKTTLSHELRKHVREKYKYHNNVYKTEYYKLVRILSGQE